MIKISTIKLYKIGEVVKILKENFNFKTDTPTLCRKATILNAYVKYKEVRYIPEDIIYHLTVDIKFKTNKINTKEIIEQKLEIINQEISKYDIHHTIPPIEAIQQIKTNNRNTTKFIKAFLELTEKIQNIEEQTQQKIQNIEEQTRKEIQNIKEETQKEIRNKDQTISKLQQKIQNIQETQQEQIQIKLLKEVKNTLNYLVQKEAKKNNCYKLQHNK
ncbi:DUF3450 domain-containing protein [Borrelia hispanica]|uniref:hypothetical protein n=1 Tax=Borrelia hispanica TaxID=40835 RepID=UPI0004660E6A|nr:hypothetical protein [Borrelia hispanica]